MLYGGSDGSVVPVMLAVTLSSAKQRKVRNDKKYKKGQNWNRGEKLSFALCNAKQVWVAHARTCLWHHISLLLRVIINIYMSA